MTKSELIEHLSEKLKLPNGKAELIINCVFDSMVDALQNGDGIEIRGFGSFTVRDYKSYEGRNPRTGETVHVAPKRLPFFKVGKDLRERVNAMAPETLWRGDDSDDDDDEDDARPAIRESGLDTKTHESEESITSSETYEPAMSPESSDLDSTPSNGNESPAPERSVSSGSSGSSPAHVIPSSGSSSGWE